MLSSYGHLKNILNSAKNLLSNSVLYQVIELKKLSLDGARFNLYKCDGCNKIFEHSGEEIVYVFLCGHKYHFECASYHNQLVCVLCKKNQMENSVTNPNIVSKQSLIEKDYSKLGITSNLNVIKQNSGIETDKKKSISDILADRLKACDKIFMERDSLVIIILLIHL